MPAQHSTAVHYGEVPIVNNDSELEQACASLRQELGAFVISEDLMHGRGLRGRMLNIPRRKRAFIRGELAYDDPRVWTVRGPIPVGGMGEDVGFHGNPPQFFSESGTVHLHRTFPGSAVEITFADATPRYGSQHNGHLHELLGRDLTDPRYVDPGTFRRVRLGAEVGGTVLFNLNHPKTGVPLLHDFKSLSSPRNSEVYQFRPHSEHETHGEIDAEEFLAFLMGQLFGGDLPGDEQQLP